MYGYLIVTYLSSPFCFNSLVKFFDRFRVRARPDVLNW